MQSKYNSFSNAKRALYLLQILPTYLALQIFLETIVNSLQSNLQTYVYSIILQEKIGLSSFTPIQTLGKGSFGEVFLVEKKDTKQYYAMKVLSKRKILGQNLVRYARTERNVLSYMKHPFIVGLNFAFQTNNKLFLILDYAAG